MRNISVNQSRASGLHVNQRRVRAALANRSGSSRVCKHASRGQARPRKIIIEEHIKIAVARVRELIKKRPGRNGQKVIPIRLRSTEIPPRDVPPPEETALRRYNAAHARFRNVGSWHASASLASSCLECVPPFVWRFASNLSANNFGLVCRLITEFPPSPHPSHSP